MATILNGIRVILRLLLELLRRIVEFWIEVLCRKRDRGEKDVCCIDPPPDVRARTDPYIYSQQWLWLRGMAFVWDNPDFTLIDKVTGFAVDNHHLSGNHDYRVQALIHNGSVMTAFGTQVLFEVLEFGAGGVVVASLGTVTLDVPGAGSATAEVPWRTPPSGHNCLRATISQADDANPLNNVGQHNTDIAEDAGSAKELKFVVRNAEQTVKAITLQMDAYRLPASPMRAETEAQRRSVAYLRRLQAANDRRKFPVPEALGAELSRAKLELAPGDTQEIALRLNDPPASLGEVGVNVNVIAGDQLIGGITAYVGKKA